MSIKEIAEKLKKDKKVRVNVTLSGSLVKRLEKYKEQHNITQLSPMVDLMLKEWIEKEDLKNKKRFLIHE